MILEQYITFLHDFEVPKPDSLRFLEANLVVDFIIYLHFHYNRLG